MFLIDSSNSVTELIHFFSSLIQTSLLNLIIINLSFPTTLPSTQPFLHCPQPELTLIIFGSFSPASSLIHKLSTSTLSPTLKFLEAKSKLEKKQPDFIDGMDYAKQLLND